MGPRLRVTIDLPSFWVDGTETEEDIDAAMGLLSDQCVVVFCGAEGDSPQKYLRTLEGVLVKAECYTGAKDATEGVNR